MTYRRAVEGRRATSWRSQCGSDRLRLTGGDALTVSVDGGPARTLTLRSGATVDQHDAATLSGVVVGSQLVIALDRVGEESAPETRAVT